mgnify:CR=1 FL=1
MILANAMAEKGASAAACDAFLLMLAPLAPHAAEELWHRGERIDAPSIFTESWPEYDAALLADERSVIAVQVNGKLRETFEIESDAAEEAVKERALALPKILQWTDGKEIVKVVVVKGKIVNIVIKE